MLPWPQTQISVAGATVAGCALPADHPLGNIYHPTSQQGMGNGLFSGIKAVRKR